MELTCNQVILLMNFYLEDKITPQMKYSIEKHLEICPKCRKIYEKYKNENKNFENSTIPNEIHNRQFNEFKEKLSAYVDNELDERENLKIKKMTITNSIARKNLENMYSLKRYLHNSFEKTRDEIKTDYVKNIMPKLTNNITERNNNDFVSLVRMFFVMTSILVFSLVVIFSNFH